MHVDFTITLGNILTWVAFVGTVIRVEKFMSEMRTAVQIFRLEHEILIRDYCERHGLKIDDFPTRLKGPPLTS